MTPDTEGDRTPWGGGGKHTDKQRIEFIDLAKGICILLVVLYHCDPYTLWPGLNAVRMPLYFLLSGLFFKDYGGFARHVTRKATRLLLPFSVAYLVSYVPFYLLMLFRPELLDGTSSGILDLFYDRYPFNLPVWFLLCLFWVNTFYCLISLNIHREYRRGIVCGIIGIFGLFLGKMEINLLFYLDSAMTALPFFYLGVVVRKLDLLGPSRMDRYNVWIALGLYGLVYAITQLWGDNYFLFCENDVYGRISLSFLTSLLMVAALLLLCKTVKRIPFISYCGKYSVVILCMHYMFQETMKQYLINNDLYDWRYWTAPVALLLSLPFVPVFRRWLLR